MVLSEADAKKAPLLGQVVILEDPRGQRLVLASLDLIALGGPLCATMQLRLACVAGVSPEAVILNSSHTHSGPFAHYDESATLLPKPRNLIDYELWLVDQMASAAGEALRHLAPATVDRYLGECHIGINRRRPGVDGQVAMGPNPEGVYNPELLLFDIVQPESGARCLAFSHACHPVIDVGWNRTLLSPDFPGEAREALKERFGSGIQVQFFQAACGNVRPRLLSDFEKGSFRPSADGDARKIGQELAQAVEATLRSEPQRLALELASVAGWALVPKKMSVHLTREDFETMVEQGGARGEAARYWLERGVGAQELAAIVPWPVGIFSLAPDCRIAWFGGEPFAEWQAFLRRSLHDPGLIIWGYTGPSAGYLPCDEHLAEGGYEVSVVGPFRKTGPRPLGPGIDAAMATAFVQLKERLACCG